MSTPAAVDPEAASSLLAHLPALYSDPEHPFLGRFLLAFEAVLHGLPDADGPGLRELVESVPGHFDPERAPSEFLPWLAGWVAFTVRSDWDEETTRGFIREAVPLYRLRGTAAGLQRMLEIYLRPLSGASARDDVQVIDDFDTPAHYFQVRLTLNDDDPSRLRATQDMARAIIDREKPAHTFYALKVVFPTMRLNPGLQLGVNTWLGTAG